MEATGANPTKIIDYGFHPSWSPDGKDLVFTTVNVPDPYGRNSAAGWGQLYVVNVDTRLDRALYTDRAIDAFHPSWSPGGNRIAFAGLIGGQRDIWTIPASGEGKPRAVLDDVHTDWGPFWSPDGNYLYFLSDRGPQGKPDLWRVGIDQETGERQGAPEVVWAPDVGRVIEASISGETIVCTLELIESWIGKIAFDPENGNAIGGETQIYSTSNKRLADLSLSPDDEWLAFATTRGVEDVFVVRPNGGPPQQVTNDLHKDRYPAWYPKTEDGLWLTFASNRVGPEYQIWAARPDGTEPTKLTDGPISNFPRWWPDGERLSASYGNSGRMVFQFPEGLSGGTFTPGRVTITVQGNASWSPNERLIAQTPVGGGVLSVFSEDPSSFDPHIVEDQSNDAYLARGQTGDRWLDDQRLILWSRGRAYLWDVVKKVATPIEGISEPAEFVFSEDGRTLYMLRRNTNRDIWMLEPSK